MLPKHAIVHAPNKALRRVAAGVPLREIANRKVQRLISDMKEILRETPDGVGLAASQVNVPLRIFIVSSEAARIDANIRIDANDTNKPQRWEYHVFINPVLKKHSRKKIEIAEGCLSLPRKYGLVPRAEKVSLIWFDEHGSKHERGFTRFFARVIQHELDHLDGVLITDRAKKLFDATKAGNQQ